MSPAADERARPQPPRGVEEGLGDRAGSARAPRTARWRRGRCPARWAPAAPVLAARARRGRRRAGGPRRCRAAAPPSAASSGSSGSRSRKPAPRPSSTPAGTIGPRNSRSAEKARRIAPISSRIGPGPRKWRDRLKDEVDPERHQRHAEVQAPSVADVHRLLASAAARAPSPTALSPSQRKKPRPPSCRSGPRPRASAGSPAARSAPTASSAASVSAIARRTSRPTRSLVFSGPIRCP